MIHRSGSQAAANCLLPPLETMERTRIKRSVDGETDSECVRLQVSGHVGLSQSVFRGRGCVNQLPQHVSPILGEVMPEEIVGSQFDGFLRRD